MDSTQQRTVFSHFAHFLAGVALLRATPLVFVAELHPNSRALRNLLAKTSRARITVRRFERPPLKRFNETSRHANVARRSVFFFSRVEQKKQHKLSEKVVDFFAESRQLLAHSSQLFQVASPPSSQSRPKRWN